MLHRRLAAFAVALLLLVGCGGETGGGAEGVSVARRQGLNVCYLSMNNQRAPFNDVRVRKAVAYALDKDRIVAMAYRGFAKPATVPVPPTIKHHHTGIVDRKQDLDKARALLNEAGLSGAALEVSLSHGNNSRPYMPSPADVAKQVAGVLEKIGFTVEIRQEEWASYLKQVQNGEHQMALLGWSADVPDADNFLYVLLDKTNARMGSANNISFYMNEEVHQKLTRARTSADPAERERLYHEAQEIIFEEVPMVPLVYTERFVAYDSQFSPVEVEMVTHPVLRRIKEPKDGSLVYLRGNDSVKLDPGDVTDGESSKVVEQIFDQLVRFAPGTIDIEPSLATSWKSSEDRKTWTFQIREGVKFHDGTDLDGAAVANAFERQRDPNHPHHFDDGVWAYWQDLFGFVEKVEVGSHPMEVIWRCSTPAPPFFLEMLGAFNCSIPSPAALEKHGKAFRRNPVGTGPFQFKSWQSGVEIVLERNAAYWDGAPGLREVVFAVSENPTVRAQRLEAGQNADLIDNLDAISVGKFLKAKASGGGE